ncbi:EpsG family protein [Niameybacter massiliensis]|uniref:EpsG family protein n=1 Tax=Holtiella tumoricola TaxID=3018743 RepID=A0AA42DQ32_9FIRM|nr:EpsG family protein [Holtiella tumoricola]MDA3733170.1 EpsG family protein [Holtiella tumoricola]
MVLQFTWCWLLYGLNIGGADYIGNETIYLAGSYLSYGDISITSTWFADLLYIIFNRLNFSYTEFNLVTGLIAFGLIFFVIWKVSKIPNIAYAMLMVYPMSEFVIQKRFFLAISAVILGIYLFSIMKNKVKKNIALFMCVIIATGLHFSAAFYITLFYMNIDDKRGWKYKMKIVLVLGLLGILAIFIGIQAGLISQVKLTNYLAGETAYISWYKIPYFFLLQIYLYYITFITFKRKRFTTVFEKNFKSYNELLICLIPTYFINTIFRRYYIHLMPLNYLIMAEEYILNFREKKSLLVHVALFLNLFIIIYLAFIETRILGDIGFDKLIVDLYRNNILFKYFII